MTSPNIALWETNQILYRFELMVDFHYHKTE